MCRGTQCQGSRDSPVVAFTSEPSSIYRCLHVQHTQQTGELPPLSTSVITTASSLLREKEKSEISSASSLLHHYWYNLWKKGSLGFKALLQIQKEIKSGYCTIQGMHSEIKAGQADRQESDPPKTHPFPPAHTQRLEQLLDQSHRQCRWGMVPSPSARPRKPVLRSQECLNLKHDPKTPGGHPWGLGPQPHGTWHEYSVLRNSVCDWFRYRGLNLVKSHWVHSQHAPITSRFVYLCFPFFKKKTKNT